MKTTLIVLNILAAVLVMPAIHGATLLVDLRMRSNYTELDRAQVIDQTKLADFAAHQTLDLTPNDRNKVPRWMCPLGIYRGAAGIPCIVGFVLNALLIGVFMTRKTRNAEQ